MQLQMMAEAEAPTLVLPLPLLVLVPGPAPLHAESKVKGGREQSEWVCCAQRDGCSIAKDLY
jgi:hypothetical protein